VSCNKTSKVLFLKTIPVTPPTVKRKISPKTHKEMGCQNKDVPTKLANHLKILIPVGTAIIIVAPVK
jgi:hypothetical protein